MCLAKKSWFFFILDTVPATLCFTILSYPIVHLSYPIVHICCSIVRVSYPIVRKSHHGFPFKSLLCKYRACIVCFVYL